jgi:predicted DNA-binding protein (MmcQ/YjbR family)
MATSKRGEVQARKQINAGGSELARLRELCLAIPGTFEKLSHGEPTWFTGEKGKVFAMFDNHHHGAAHISVHVAATLDLQELLVAQDPARYWVPPYVGHKGWIGIVLDTKPDWNVVAQLLHEAFAMVSAAKPRAGARARGTARR